MARGLLDYFPDALAEVSHVSHVGNQQHNPGQSMHWAKEKSTDHADCLIRHLASRGKRDPGDGLRESAKVAWRALAMLQMEIEAEAAGLSVDAYIAKLQQDALPAKEGVTGKEWYGKWMGLDVVGPQPDRREPCSCEKSRDKPGYDWCYFGSDERYCKAVRDGLRKDCNTGDHND